MIKIEKIDFEKLDGLVPAIIVDSIEASINAWLYE